MVSKNLKPFIPLVDALAETFGKNCEVVLHDLSKPDHSIIKIANGHLTGRDVGSPATDFLLSLLGKDNIKRAYFVGYPTKTKKGAELKSTTVFIRDGKNRTVGALCINIDITPYLSSKNVLEQLCFMTYKDSKELENESCEEFASSTDTLINDLLGQSIKKIGKPIFHMRKEDKLHIIPDLKEKGIFLIKGSAKRISRELNVSLATIYKYLEEIQKI
jgi:predicted transcriptional regulator YheO